MKNNKGVTLVELLVVIVVMGIIAGFAIPAVGNIIENANKDSVLNDALQIENAAKLYCSTNVCEANNDGGTDDTKIELGWDDISPYVEGISGYEQTTGTEIVAVGDTTGRWAVKLTYASGTEWQFPSYDGINATPDTIDWDSDATVGNDSYWVVPSEVSRDHIAASNADLSATP